MTEGFTQTEGTPINDWSFIITAGPFTINPGGYKMVGLAFLGGNNLADLQANADAAKYKSSQVLDVNENGDVLPNGFVLRQNYPNPFNPVTRISYSLPNREHVSLKVYDMLGHEVATVVNEEQTAGTHEVTFNGINLASGVYYYRLLSGSYVDTKKFILVK
jgi:hypothetical protein